MGRLPARLRSRRGHRQDGGLRRRRSTGEEGRAWQAAADTFARFDAADYYLFSIPMWNHQVPYILKQFIDVVNQPGMVFAFDPVEGYRGLLTGKKAAVIYTGAVYGEDAGRRSASTT